MHITFTQSCRLLIISMLSAIATLLIALTFGSGTVIAAEHKFCYGKNLPAFGNMCSNGTFKNMHAAFANSSDQPICLIMHDAGKGGCSKNPNEGVYVGEVGGVLSEARIFNWGQGPAKVYGVFWDGAPPPKPPRTWHFDTIGIAAYNEAGISSRSASSSDIFTRDGNGHLSRSRWPHQGGWSSPQTIGLNIASAPSSVSWDSGRIDVVARMSNNTVGHWFCSQECSSEGAWNYDNLGGNITGKPAISSWAPNRLDVFGKGAVSGQLVHKYWAGSAWHGWEGMGGYLASSPDAVSWGPNRIDVVARATDNTVWHWYWYGSGWGADNLGGQISYAPTISSWGNNRLDVFARATNGNLSHVWWGGFGWIGWENHGGNLISSPDAVSWGPERIDVVGRDANNTLAHWWYG